MVHVTSTWALAILIASGCLPAQDRLPFKVVLAQGGGPTPDQAWTGFLAAETAGVTTVPLAKLEERHLAGAELLIVTGRALPEDGDASRLAVIPKVSPELLTRLPVVLVGGVGGLLGDALQLKVGFGFGCLCLTERVVVSRPDHPIWRTPFALAAEPEAFPTPAHYLKLDASLPKTLPTFRVFERAQAEAGMVATGLGFLDSPDTEVLAGGIHSKTAYHVAIGRHGSFVLWGFQGDPAQFTEAGRKLFLNVLAYARAQKGQPLLVRRTGIPRELVRTRVDAVDLGFVRSMSLSGPFVDEDCKQLGVANRAPEFLDTLATRLAADGKDPLALRLLARYAPGAPAADLGAWLAKHRARLYFTEWGGYLWQLAPAAATGKPLTIKGLRGDEVVEIEADADGEALRLKVTVQPGYHLYPPGSDEGIPIELTLEPASSFTAGGPLQCPARAHLEGVVRLTLPLKRKGDGDKLLARFTWQACDERMCFPPATVTIER